MVRFGIASLLTILALGQDAWSVQASDLDWLVGDWGRSAPVSVGGHSYTAQLTIRRLSPDAAVGEIQVTDESRSPVSQQNFRISSGPSATLQFDLDYSGDVETPGFSDVPIGPTFASEIQALVEPSHENLTCREITHNFSLVGPNGEFILLRNEVAFKNVRTAPGPNLYPLGMTFNVSPEQDVVFQSGKPVHVMPSLALSITWKKNGARVFNSYSFRPFGGTPR